MHVSGRQPDLVQREMMGPRPRGICIGKQKKKGSSMRAPVSPAQERYGVFGKSAEKGH